VRNGHETPARLEPLRRGTTNPRFYVRSADQNGRAIEPEVMTLVLATIPESVRQWSGGRLSVAQLESGPQTREPAPGWITINIIRDMSLPYCGIAYVAKIPARLRSSTTGATAAASRSAAGSSPTKSATPSASGTSRAIAA